MELELDRTAGGVCPIVVVVLGRRGVGKTKLMEAFSQECADRRFLVIVSPIGTLKTRMPEIPWYQISVRDKEGIEKLFGGWMKDGSERFVLADEADELTAANAAGTAGGFVAQAVYDYINYGREQGLGIMLSSRRPSNIAKDVTANANLVFVANTTDPAALDYYSAWMHDPTRPQIDFRGICQVLPTFKSHPKVGTVFMVWEPGRKFLGYVTVDMARNQVKPWDPSELEGTGESTVLSAENTDPSITTDTPVSDPDGEPSASGVSSAGSVSRTEPGRSTAPPT